jgi:hypothetical protein
MTFNRRKLLVSAGSEHPSIRFRSYFPFRPSPSFPIRASNIQRSIGMAFRFSHTQRSPRKVSISWLAQLTRTFAMNRLPVCFGHAEGSGQRSGRVSDVCRPENVARRASSSHNSGERRRLCSIGRAAGFCRGGCQSRWKRPSASRRWRMPWPVTASRRYSTLTRARSSPARPSPACGPMEAPERRATRSADTLISTMAADRIRALTTPH